MLFAMISLVSTEITIPSLLFYMTMILNSNRPVYWSIILVRLLANILSEMLQHTVIQLGIFCYTSIEVNDDLFLLQRMV